MNIMIIFIVFVNVWFSTFTGSDAHNNEHWSPCGSPCPPTCPTLASECFSGPVCTRIMGCVPGCFCDAGYIRNTANNKCIRKEECPPVPKCPHKNCGKDEHYTDCGSSCSPKCPTNASECFGQSIACTEQCVPGCVCNEGFVRDTANNNKCIKKEDCPPVPGCPHTNCRKDEHYTDCGSSCPPKCPTNANECFGQSIMCTAQCVSGCFCNDGLVKDTVNNKCIKKEHCPPVSGCPHDNCGKYEHYNNCGSSCPPKCPTYESECLGQKIPCTKECVLGCFCNDGYVRDANNKCIKKEQCPPVPKCPKAKCENYEHSTKCREHEHYKECGSRCPPRCRKYLDCFGPGPVCTKECVPGCFCDDGFVKDTVNNTCIKENDCPPVPKCPQENCGKDEHFVDCGSRCPPKCPTYESECCDQQIMCTADCVPRCVCNAGYIRDANNICIRLENCPSVPKCPPVPKCPNVE